MPQHGLLQLPEPRPRLEPQLVVQHPPPRAVGLQRVRLPAAAVEREHQLGPQPFAHRVPQHLQLQLGHQRAVPAQREVGVDAVLDGAQPQLVQPGGLGPGERRVRHVGERRALPQLQRAAQHRGGLLGIVAVERGPPLLGQPDELLRVDAAGLDRQLVAARRRDQDRSRRPARAVRFERAPEVGDEDLHRGRCPGRRVLRPQVVHDLVQRHHPAGPHQERRQRRPLLAAAQLHPLAVAPRLDLAEQPELDQRPGRGVIVHRGGRGGLCHVPIVTSSCTSQVRGV